MFKKGQLVRSKDTGNLYLVVSSRAGVVTVSEPYGIRSFHVRFDRLYIIGHNYQAKPKCSR